MRFSSKQLWVASALNSYVNRWRLRDIAKHFTPSDQRNWSFKRADNESVLPSVRPRNAWLISGPEHLHTRARTHTHTHTHIQRQADRQTKISTHSYITMISIDRWAHENKPSSDCSTLLHVRRNVFNRCTSCRSSQVLRTISSHLLTVTCDWLSLHSLVRWRCDRADWSTCATVSGVLCDVIVRDVIGRLSFLS